MAKNTGKPSEQAFDDYWKTQGKSAWVFRFADSSSLTGLNGKKTQALAQPSDRPLIWNGNTEFAEVKSTQDATAFRFSLLRIKQSAYATMILAAGGSYNVYIHAMLSGRWYKIPYQKIKYTRDVLKKESIPWVDLDTEFQCFELSPTS